MIQDINKIQTLEDAARYLLEHVEDLPEWVKHPENRMLLGLHALKRGEIGEFILHCEAHFGKRAIYSARWRIKRVLPKMDFWRAYDPDYSNNYDWEQWMRHFIKLLSDEMV